tara:strand:- start:375 stop:908 length:534 start_codon:yes stop_codon:yes gene_type:complete
LVRSRNTDDTQLKKVSVAVVVGTWGVKGHVKVKRFGSSSEIFNPGSIVSHNKGDLIVQNARSTRSQNNDILIVKFESIDSIEKAEALKGLDLKILQSALKDLPEWNYYHYELIGLKVFSVEGEDIGILKKIIETGANDVYVVISDVGDEVLYPAIKEVILEVNIDSQFLIVEPQNII